MGLKLVGSGPDSKGWWKCRAIDREDKNPSATFNFDKGYYVDHGPSGTRLTIFGLAMARAPAEYPNLCATIDKLGDRYIGERNRVGNIRGSAPVSGPAAGPVAPVEPAIANAVGDEPTGIVSAPPVLDVPEVRRRVREIVEAKDLSRLYADAGLLVDLARLERDDPAAFEGIKATLSGMKGFGARGFSAALAQHRPPDEAAPEEMVKGSDVGLLIELGSDGVELFHDPGNKAYALIRDGERLENLAVRGSAIRRWLKVRYYRQTGSAPGLEVFRSGLEVLELMAGEGPVHEVNVRTAEVVGTGNLGDVKLYLDLADEGRRAVEISKDGWSVMAAPTPRFLRPPGMLPLPEPRRGGSLDDLWRFVNVRETDRVLLLAWMTFAFRPKGPFPILILNGEQGTAKSSTSNAIRRLIDPNSAPLRGIPDDERDLMIAASNSRIIAFDNLSLMTDWLSDVLCRLAFGVALSCRQLYSDDEEVFFSACRPIMFNGIEEIANRGDLLQRSFLFDLPFVRDVDRRAETPFWADYDEARPSILGALLDLAVGALAALPGIRLEVLPRMADIAVWGEAVCRAMGRPPGEFILAYSKNLAKGSEIALESSPITLAVIALMVGRAEWTGTAQALLRELEDRTEEHSRRKNWPASPRGLSGPLRRAAPALRSLGTLVDFVVANDKSKTRTIAITNYIP